MLCQVCGATCRGKCAKCQTALCAEHKPESRRAKCAFCSKSTAAGSKRASAAPVAPKLVQSTLLPTPSVPLSRLTRTAQLTWIADRRERLKQKQARERAYLDRRAARGIHTSTDDAYEADTLLENDLLEALDLLEKCLQGGFPALTLVGASKRRRS